MKHPLEGIADPQDTAYSKNEDSQVFLRESQVQSFPAVIKSFLKVIKSFPEATKSFLRVGLKPSSSHGLKHRNLHSCRVGSINLLLPDPLIK